MVFHYLLITRAIILARRHTIIWIHLNFLNQFPVGRHWDDSQLTATIGKAAGDIFVHHYALCLFLQAEFLELKLPGQRT